MSAAQKLQNDLLSEQIASLRNQIEALKGAPVTTTPTPAPASRSLEDILGGDSSEKETSFVPTQEQMHRGKELAEVCLNRKCTATFGQAKEWLQVGKPGAYRPSDTGAILVIMRRLGCDFLIVGKKGFAEEVRAKHETRLLAAGIPLPR